jgi:peptidoglycan hydrolase-like protein with peptidoglycan-binding domain
MKALRFPVSPVRRGTVWKALAAIGLSLALSLPAMAQDESQLSRNEVFQIQFYLNQLGFPAGEPDGLDGPQTRKAAADFAAANGGEAALTADLLVRIEEKTRPLEGWKRADGSIDTLIFTDQNTALLFKVIAAGQIHKSPDKRYIRDQDTDGSPIYSNRFDVSHMTGTDNIPLAAGTAFGYHVRITPPPAGERLQIDHLVFEPYAKEDGALDYRLHVYEHVYLKPPGSNTRYWYWHFDRAPANAKPGIWPFALTNSGRTLIKREFELVRPD